MSSQKLNTTLETEALMYVSIDRIEKVVSFSDSKIALQSHENFYTRNSTVHKIRGHSFGKLTVVFRSIPSHIDTNR